MPYTITGAFDRGILVRTSVPPTTLLKNVQQEIWAVDRNIAMTFAGSLEEYLERFSYAEPRFGLVLLSVFAGIGMVLVAVGVFSVIAYTVTRQTQEIGIRMALGAGRSHVLGMVLRMGLRLLGAGISVGLVASFGVTRVLASQLWEISPRDPLTLASAVTVVLVSGISACYFPAHRATKIDPLLALRYE